MQYLSAYLGKIAKSGTTTEDPFRDPLTRENLFAWHEVRHPECHSGGGGTPGLALSAHQRSGRSLEYPSKIDRDGEMSSLPHLGFATGSATIRLVIGLVWIWRCFSLSEAAESRAPHVE